MNRFSGAPLGDAYTSARPNGCPQSNTVGVGPAGGHDGASPDTPCTLKPASRTRSPCGPNANDPGWRTRNRHARWSLFGSKAHARPSATKATVSLATAFPPHPVGRALPSARVAPAGEGGTVEVGGGAVDGGASDDVVEDVQDAATSVTQSTRKIARTRMLRTLHPGRGRRKRR